MKICKTCKKQFSSYLKIDGKKKSLSSRKSCLECVPYGTYGRTWTDQDLIKAVKSSFSYSDVMRKLNLTIRGGNWASLKKHIKLLDISIKHFVGDKIALSKLQKTLSVSNKQVFCERSKVSQGTLRKRFKGLKV